MTRIRSILLGTGTSLVLVLSACGNGPPPDQGTGGTSGGGGASSASVQTVTSGTAVSTVKQTDDLTFAPTSVSVKVGDIVGFTNSGTTPHNVTFDAGTASPTMNGGDTFLVKFGVAGTYHYVCTFHAPGMAGTITVG
ncbi:MAG: cupredoxin domain-containing protein [Candidatus Dormibacteria bacterium]